MIEDSRDNARIAISSNEISKTSQEIRSGVVDALISVDSLSGDGDAEKIKKFADSVAEMMTSKPFLTKAAATISDPRPGETEEEYVARGVETIRSMLRAQFKIKK